MIASDHHRSIALGLKLLAPVLAAGGALAGLLALAVTRLPTVERDGSWLYLIPGNHGRTVLDPRIVTVLAVIAVAFCALALAAGLALLAVRSPDGAARQTAPSAAGATRRRKSVRLLVAGLIVLAMAIPIRWYGYVAITRSPDSAVGGWLNAHAPALLRDWGCARLRERFADRPAPVECRNPDGSGAWR